MAKIRKIATVTLHRGDTHVMPNGTKHTPYYFHRQGHQPDHIGVLTEYPGNQAATIANRREMAIKIKNLQKNHFRYINGTGPSVQDIITLLQTSATMLKTDYTVDGLVPEHRDYYVFSGIITTDTGRTIQFVHRVYCPLMVYQIRNTIRKFAIYSEEMQFSNNSYRRTFISQTASV